MSIERDLSKKLSGYEVYELLKNARIYIIETNAEPPASAIIALCSLRAVDSRGVTGWMRRLLNVGSEIETALEREITVTLARQRQVAEIRREIEQRQKETGQNVH